MGYELRAVIETDNFMNQAFHRVIGFNVREDWSEPFVFVPLDRIDEHTAAYELKQLNARRAKAKIELAEARELRKDVDRLVERLEGEAG